MKITIIPTSELTEMDGHPVRLWKGQTETGIPVVLAVHCVIVREDHRQAESERDLQTAAPPAEDRQKPFPAAMRAIDIRRVL